MDHRRMVPPPLPLRPGGATAKPKTPAGAVGGGTGAAAAAAATSTTPGVSPTKAAQPQFGASFDPWNSSSSGHQRAENRLGASTGWRDSRNAKLHAQFRGDAKRVSDAVGAGARDWDPKLQAVVPPELRARARCSVADMLAKPRTMQRSLSSLSSSSSTSLPSAASSSTGVDTATSAAPNKGGQSSTARTTEENERLAEYAEKADDEDKKTSPDQEEGPGRLFAGVVVYVNGSTHPQISDHQLKHVLAKHGGRLSSHLGRRQVTHVILGRPIGGGLAGSKLQKEIQKVRGAAVKFVGVEWILESIKAGKRLPESRFGNVKVASKGQQSVFRLSSKPTPPPPALAASAAESCIPGSGVGLYPASSSKLGDEPPPSAQRN